MKSFSIAEKIVKCLCFVPFIGFYFYSLSGAREEVLSPYRNVVQTRAVQETFSIYRDGSKSLAFDFYLCRPGQSIAYFDLNGDDRVDRIEFYEQGFPFDNNEVYKRQDHELEERFHIADNLLGKRIASFKKRFSNRNE